MACVGCGTTNTCDPDIQSPHIAIKGGWGLSGWPPFVSDAFKANYQSSTGIANPSWPGNTHTDVLNAIKQVLNANSVSIDHETLCSWANEQWCQRDPGRCLSSGSKDSTLAAQRNASLIGDSMQWATPFWRIWNVAVSDNLRHETEALPIMERFINLAKYLVTGDAGCSRCYEHFTQLLEIYPVERIGSFKQARVWLWRIHNESRENKKPTPYYDIAKIYGWDLLSDEEIFEIINQLRA